MLHSSARRSFNIENFNKNVVQLCRKSFKSITVDDAIATQRTSFKADAAAKTDDTMTSLVKSAAANLQKLEPPLS
jgi:hypothetical protein